MVTGGNLTDLARMSSTDSSHLTQVKSVPSLLSVVVD